MQEDMLKVLSILKEQGVDQKAFLSKKQILTYEKKYGSSDLSITQNFNYILGTLPLSIPREIIWKIHQKTLQLNINVQIESKVQEGELFKDYGDIENVLDDSKTILTHKHGEVLCLYFLTLWRKPSKKHILQLSKSMQNNLNWKDRVKIIAVYASEQKQHIKKFVENQKCSNLNHLTTMKPLFSIPLSLLQSDFKIGNHFDIVLVNKFGKIDYIGDIENIDFQKRIIQLVEHKNQNQLTFSQTTDPLLFQTNIQSLTESLSKERVEKYFEDIEQITLTFIIQTINRNNRTSMRPIIKATIIEGDHRAEKKVHSFLKQHQNVTLKLKTVKYITVPSTEGAKCWECSRNLRFYPFYWLKWQDGIKFGCIQCVEAISTLEGHHYKYEKNSVLLMGKWEKIAAKNFLQNIQPIHPKHVQFEKFRKYCDNCHQNVNRIGRESYFFQGCQRKSNSQSGTFNLCQLCISKQIISKLRKVKQKQHSLSPPYLRVLYGQNQFLLPEENG